MAYDYQLISKIQRPGVASPDNIRDAYKTGIYTVIGTQTAKTGEWTGALHGVPALYDGLTINYYLPYDGNGNATLELTLDDGTTTGAINCYITTSRLTTHQGAGRTIVMTYQSAGSISVKGEATADNRWICDAYYDTNSNDTAYYVRRYYPKIVAGTNKIFPYTIIMQNADGRWESIVTSSSTGTSKARNTHGFRLGQLLLMYANATYAENAEIGNTNVWEMHSLIDHRQSFNTANNATSGTVAKKPYYLVGSINSSDGLFYLDTTWWTKDLPSTEDGKLYIYLGDAYDYYRMSFAGQHPIYHYVNGKIREFAQDAATVNGHTVAADVPSNAKFTDTQANWTQTISTELDYIKNKPTLGTASAKDVPSSGNASTTQVVMGNDTRLSDARPASNVTDTYSATGTAPVSGKAVAAALGTLDGSITGSPAASKTLTAFSETDGKVSATFADINITKSQISDFPTIPIVNNATLTIQKNGTTVKTFTANASSNVTANITVPTTAADVSAIATSAKGTANGVAELDANGLVPASQLPSYVDDVLEQANKSSFPTTGETGKIYVAIDTNLTYRWSGSAYVEISPSLALGETSSTAYRGDRGKTAYDHSQLTSGNPHNVTKTDVGLGNVGNFKAVSTVASQGLTNTEKSNARANIGAGTSNLTIGTSATTAAAGNHTHTTAIATDSGTNQLTMAANTKYKLTSGGTTYIFTTPPDSDTKNTAGSTDTSSKIYLVGATSQAANPQTYSDNEVYATSGVLTTKSVQIGGGAATMQYNSTTQSIDFIFS